MRILNDIVSIERDQVEQRSQERSFKKAPLDYRTRNK